ncbi:MAG: hypothetical protein ABIT83_25890 [Massilia sp.]
MLVGAICWDELLTPPPQVQALWTELVTTWRDARIVDLSANREAVKVLLKLFAIADEASAGMGWKVDPGEALLRELADVVMENMIDPVDVDQTPLPGFRLPFWPTSLCGMITPDRAVVLPKSITTTKGCTIRSLSHHLALLPCRPVLEVSWLSVARPEPTRR